MMERHKLTYDISLLRDYINWPYFYHAWQLKNADKQMEIKEEAMRMLDTFGLQPKQKIKSMSKGMQEKLQLILVMCRNAKLYIFDEPLSGVDPAARDGILDIIMKNHPKDSTMLISTHLIHDVESIFDHALMIGQGKVLLNSSVDDICSSGKTLEDVFKEVFKYAWQID